VNGYKSLSNSQKQAHNLRQVKIQNSEISPSFRISRALDHSNTCSIFISGSSGGTPYSCHLLYIYTGFHYFVQ